MKQRNYLSLFAGAITLAFAGATYAQAAANEELAEVTVTGSRVITNGNNSPTPVTVMTVEDLQASHPARVFESLLDVPAFAGSRGGISTNPSGNRATSNQISALNLRGLGPVRTLVLYDGHRVPPTELDGFVDANIIPQMLLQRVDIVTGGASAVYGSDAIGGVVNFVTDRKFNGVKVDVQGGLSERRDAGTYQIGAAFGSDLFGGRGHVEASVQSLHDDGILHRTDREQFRGNWTVQGNGCPNGVGSANCVPYFLVADARNSTWTYGGKIVGPATNPLRNTTFANNSGVLAPFVNGSVAGLPTGSLVQIGGDGIWDTSSSLKPQQTVNQGFARFDFDVTDSLHYFLVGTATTDHAFNYYGNANSNSVILSPTNAFLAPIYQQQMTAAGVTSFTFSKKYGLDSLIPPSPVDFFTKNFYVNTGFEGKLGAYKWEASYSHSTVKLDARSNYTFNNGRFFAAIDAVRDPSGNIVCNVTLTNPGLYPGCVPLNLFGPSSESQAALDYARQQGQSTTSLPMDDFAANIAGAVFNDWAGPVSVALSGEWRQQGMEITSNKPTINFAPLNCTGIRFNCTPATATNIGTTTYNGGVAPRTPVHMTVAEGAVEADVPLLKDLPLAQSANLNLAYRFAKYTAVGNPDLTAPSLNAGFNANTWKVGLDWHFTDIVSLRATRSRDIRAPNLNELFQTNGITFTNGITDLLTNRNVTAAGVTPQVITGGNPGLHPEVATTSTVGVVFKLNSDFSFALDAYDIKVSDFIASLNGGNPIIQQGCYTGNAAFCALQQRPGPLTDKSAANAATAWYTVPANVSLMRTKGIDLEVNYRADIAGRPFSARGLVAYQPHVLFYLPGSPVQDFAGALGTPLDYATGAPVRVTVSARYRLVERLTADWQTTWRSKLHQSPDATLLEQPNAGAPSVAFSNVTLTYDLPTQRFGQASLYLNVQNVFDKAAPVAASLVDQSSPGISGGFVPGDDPTGRYYRLGARFKW